MNESPKSKDKFHRRSTRLKGYDYSIPNAYFVTVCIQDKRELFGVIRDGGMALSKIGNVARDCWKNLPKHFTDIELDEFIVMPNHIHGIVVILDNLKSRGVQLNAPTRRGNYYSQISPVKKSLGIIIRTYKATVTTWCRNNNYDHFQWQRSYYDHVIRNEKSLTAIREYISTNPLRWHLDIENPCHH